MDLERGSFISRLEASSGGGNGFGRGGSQAVSLVIEENLRHLKETHQRASLATAKAYFDGGQATAGVEHADFSLPWSAGSAARGFDGVPGFEASAPGSNGPDVCGVHPVVRPTGGGDETDGATDVWSRSADGACAVK